jgi:hypothetical protein
MRCGRIGLFSEENVMPLRDLFHPPVSKRASWEGFHGLWPGIIVQELAPRLPLAATRRLRVDDRSRYYPLLNRQQPIGIQHGQTQFH